MTLASTPDAWIPVARLLLAALFGGLAGASLLVIVLRRGERTGTAASRTPVGTADAAERDAAGIAAGSARTTVPATVPGTGPEPKSGSVPEPGSEPNSGSGLESTPGSGSMSGSGVRAGVEGRGEAVWRARCDELTATARGARRRVEGLLAEQQAAEERQAKLEGELRALRRERDYVATALAGTPRAAGPAPARLVPDEPVGRPVRRTGRAEGGVPVLNRRVEAAARVPDVASIDDHYPMLAESELPARSETLRLEDLLDGGPD